MAEQTIVSKIKDNQMSQTIIHQTDAEEDRKKEEESKKRMEEVTIQKAMCEAYREEPRMMARVVAYDEEEEHKKKQKANAKNIDRMKKLYGF
jgi:hypothetical protein